MVIFYLLLIVHLLVDFIFQNDCIVKKRDLQVTNFSLLFKKTNNDWNKFPVLMMKHALLHSILSILLLFYFISGNIGAVFYFFVFTFLYFYISHFLVDYLKVKCTPVLYCVYSKIVMFFIGSNSYNDSLINNGFSLEKNEKKISTIVIGKGIGKSKVHIDYFDVLIFLFDQLCHIVLIIIFLNIIGEIHTDFFFTEYLIDIFYTNTNAQSIQISLHNCNEVYIKHLTAIIILTKPFNIFYKKIWGQHNDNLETLKTGCHIGSMERIFVYLSMITQQYNIIGFILTFKSIVRFKKFEKNDDFVEYFILGTLFSVLGSIGVYYLFNFLYFK